MAEQPITVPIHPVAPRLKSGPKTPHIGPHRDDYHAEHKNTVGHESDTWWAKVRILPFLGIGADRIYFFCLFSKRMQCCTGIAHSKQLERADLRPVTSSGSQRVV